MSDRDPMPGSMTEICDACGGEGIDLGEMVYETCSECGGDGYLDHVRCPDCRGNGCRQCFGEGYLEDVRCPECDTTGEIGYHPRCDRCRGRGTCIASEFYHVS